MITGKQLKDYAAVIPDDAVVYIGKNQHASIVGVEVSTFPFLNANLELTPGFSITKDSVLDELFRQKTSIPGHETR